ncbi:MAG: alginate export family protein [Myxococcota bacterium]
MRFLSTALSAWLLVAPGTLDAQAPDASSPENSPAAQPVDEESSDELAESDEESSDEFAESDEEYVDELDGELEEAVAAGPAADSPEPSPSVSDAATETAAFEEGPAAVSRPSPEEADPSTDALSSTEAAGPQFSLGGELRARGEGRYRPYRSTGLDDGEYRFESRLRISVGASYGPARVFLQLQDARSFGGLAGGVTSFHQGYVEFGDEAQFIRAGRQEINLGGQRMIGALNWANAARSFDAIRGHVQLGGVALDGFASMIRPPETMMVQQTIDGMPEEIEVESDGDYLAGAYLVAPLSEDMSLDGYVLYRHDSATATAPERSRDIVAVGTRVHGSAGPLRLDVEGIVQSGDSNGSSHLAFGGAADVGYALDIALPTTVTAGIAYGSGDSGGDVDEFENFFPTNHKFYGVLDLFGLRNMVNAQGIVALAPSGVPLSLRFLFHQFWLAEKSGRWSDAPGRTLGQSDTLSSAALGSEIDTVITYKPLEGLSFQLGGGVFVPQAGARQLGFDEPQVYVYLMSGYRLR